MKDLNWLEMINRLYLVVWFVFSWVVTGFILNDISADKILQGAIGIVAACGMPYVLRKAVRWVYAGLQTKKTG